MATYSSGISVTWGGVAFQEVTSLSWSWGGSLPRGRSVIWTDDVGTVTVECLGGNNTSTSEYGTRDDLVISGGGSNLTCKAIYQSLTVSPELNGVTRYSVTFKILDG